MPQTIALILVILSGFWLYWVAWQMAVRPSVCLHWLGLMASTWRINLTELGLRALAGLAFVVRSGASKAPQFFELFGWFLFASAIVLVLVPRRWHAGYAVFWSRSLSARTVRLFALPTAAFASALIYCAL